VLLVTIFRCSAFERPAVTHQLNRQPVEQLRMRRRLALHAEVVERGDDAGPKDRRPLPIHRHPRGERVLLGDDPAGEVETIRLPVNFERRQHGGNARLDRLLGLQELAAMMTECRPRILRRPLPHHKRGRILRPLLQLADFLRLLRQLGLLEQELVFQTRALLLGELVRIDGEQSFDLRRQIAGLGAAGIRGNRDAKPAQRAGKVPAEGHRDRKRVGIERLLQHEHRRVPLTLPAVDRPARLRVSVHGHRSRRRVVAEAVVRKL
jgi:hypothetical protein